MLELNNFDGAAKLIVLPRAYDRAHFTFSISLHLKYSFAYTLFLLYAIDIEGFTLRSHATRTIVFVTKDSVKAIVVYTG